MKFFQSFLDLYHQRKLDEESAYFRHADFRKLYLEERGKNVNSIKVLSIQLLPSILKPQQPIEDHDDFYVAKDLYTNTFYVCYRQLMMIDIDFYKDSNNEDIEGRIKQYATQHPECRFRLYQSRNGIHSFLISKKSDYKESIQTMLDLGCDFNYIVYSYIRGWCVRLNRKKSDDRMLYKLIGDIGEAPIDSEMEKMVNLHIKLCEVFTEVGPSLMFDG